ncbi:hypothetical protein ACXN1G_07790 [Rhodococcus ruber]
MALITAARNRLTPVASAGHTRGTWVLAAALVLIVLQLAVRALLAFGGQFYWDDLILVGRAGLHPLLSFELLGYDHDGHLMPGAFVVADVITSLAPLQWWPAAATLVAGQALASLAVLRVLWLLLGPRPALLGPLLFYLFTPLTLPAFAWWAAGLNSLPLQAGLAWVAGDAIRAARTGRLRYALSGTAVTGVALLFFEKSVLVPAVAFATVALMYGLDGHPRPVRTAARRAAPLWLGSALVLAAWAAAYLSLVESRFGAPTGDMVRGLTHHGVSFGVLPALLGGPWRWDRWNPGPPWADPPTGLVVAAWAAVLAVLVWSLRRSRRTGWVWAATAAYVAASTAAMITTRFGPDTTYELAQTLRYHTDTAVVVAIGTALILRAGPRDDPRRAPARRIVAAGCAVVFTASCLWSTTTFARTWADNPTGAYLAAARSALTARPDVPILDHPVSVWVLLPVTHPHNLLSRVFSPLPGRAEIGAVTTELQVLDDRGRPVPAELVPVRHVLPGPVPDCGHLLTESRTTVLPADTALVGGEWTVQLNYRASAAGEIEVGFPAAPRVRVPVTEGLGTAYARVPGAGTGLQARSASAGLDVCLAGGPIGVVVPR